ncbi:hypothetical protein [Geminisphaera colitermitum]|uniref:hypothetical protein n=1 Tax=Geminisphaera colitermitum TaxID=1148786 RepID=UPI000158C955|nr:hypothetical protein [Geminisphaera colitermitum]
MNSLSDPKHTRLLTTLLAIAVGVTSLALAPTSLQAATIGYWRFEASANLGKDSGSNGLNLTLGGDVGYAAIPGTGAGSWFPDTILQTGAANTGALLFGTGTTTRNYAACNETVDRTTIQNLFAASPSFTIESIFHYDTHTDYQGLVGRWQTSSDRRGWYVRINANGEVVFNYSVDGKAGATSSGTISSGITLANDKDYYLGITFDSTLGGNITFWYQNLSDPTSSLTSVSVENTFGTIFNPLWGVEIGSISALSASGTPVTYPRQMASYVDEIRLSTGVLNESQLLVSVPIPVPEPATTVLIAGVAILILVLRARHRNSRR